MTTTLSGPAGTTFFAELVGGVAFPATKIHSGATDADGGAITAANPFFVQLSDGSAAFTGAKTGQLPTAPGSALTANAMPVTAARGSTSTFSSVATAGVALVSGAGKGFSIQFDNNTGGSIYCMVFDATTTRSNGAQALWKGAVIATAASSTLQLGGNVDGLPFTSGLWLQFSSTLGTLTALASTSIIGTYSGT